MRSAPHPFDKWFKLIEFPEDELVLELVKDFTCSPESMVRQLRAEAARRDVVITAQVFKPRNFTKAIRVRQVFKHEGYPWDKWLDGFEHVLRRGQQFRPPAAHFAKQVHGAAARRGQQVTVRTKDDWVVVRALTPMPGLVSPVVSGLLERLPSRRYSLAEIEQALRDGGVEEVPQARALAGVLKHLKWRRVRTAEARYWLPPANKQAA